MKKPKSKILIPVIILGAGALIYFKFIKKAPEPEPEIKPEPEVKPKLKAKKKSKAKAQVIIAPAKTLNKTLAKDLMLSNAQKIVGKNIYSVASGLQLYDFGYKPYGTTRKDEKIGLVTGFTRASKGDYILQGKTQDNKYFKASASGVYIFS